MLRKGARIGRMLCNKFLAKQKCRKSIRHIHIFINADEACTVLGQYITAIAHIRMQDFCLSQKLQGQYSVILPDLLQ